MKYTGVCDQCGGPPVARLGEGYSSTLVGYGKCRVDSEKFHDDNCQAGEFRCAAGHTFLIYRRRKCGDEDGGSACSWQGAPSCFICNAVHVDWPKVPVVERERR